LTRGDTAHLHNTKAHDHHPEEESKRVKRDVKILDSSPPKKPIGKLPKCLVVATSPYLISAANFSALESVFNVVEVRNFDKYFLSTLSNAKPNLVFAYQFAECLKSDPETGLLALDSGVHYVNYHHADMNKSKSEFLKLKSGGLHDPSLFKDMNLSKLKEWFGEIQANSQNKLKELRS
jgi:hypothetical protein